MLKKLRKFFQFLIFWGGSGVGGLGGWGGGVKLVICTVLHSKKTRIQFKSTEVSSMNSNFDLLDKN